MTSIPEPFVFTIGLLLYLRVTGAQVIFICHDPKPHAWKLPRWLRWVEDGGHRAVFALADTVVVLAASAADALSQTYGIDRSRIKVIPHGAFDYASQGPVTGSRMLLALGMIRRNKQAHLAIQAVRLARQAGCETALVIAGAPDPDDLEYVNECRKAAEGLEDCIEFQASYLSEHDMTTLIGRADALVMPYADFASQSGVAVLAGMCGRPVIAARAGGIADLMDLGLAAVKIEAPVNAAAIAQAIIEFYVEPPTAWTERATAARRALQTALDWRRIGQQIGESFR